MRAADEELPEMPGQEAFLDVLTNMVGIIILLVVIVGIRTARSVSTSASQAEAEKVAAAIETPEDADLAKSRRDALRSRHELGRVVNQAAQVHREQMLRTQERDYLVTFVAAYSQELNDRRAALSTEEQRDFDLRSQLTEARAALETADREELALMSQPAETEVLEVRPTPIVRRNLDKELFLQVSKNHVAVIPVADLAEELRNDVDANLWRLRDADRMTGRVGPIGGYWMNYIVGRTDVEVRTAGGPTRTGSQIQLLRYELVPLTTPLGEPIDVALAPNSDLQNQLKSFPADTTTIALAVHPDSLEAMHALKKQLHEADYSVAEILLAQGKPIRFSPNKGMMRYAQ